MKKIFMCVLTALLAFSAVKAEESLSPDEIQFLRDMEAKDKSQRLEAKTIDGVLIITDWNEHFKAYESCVLCDNSDEQFLFLFESLAEALCFSNDLKTVSADNSRKKWRRQADFSEEIPASDGCFRYIIYPNGKWDMNKKKH